MNSTKKWYVRFSCHSPWQRLLGNKCLTAGKTIQIYHRTLEADTSYWDKQLANTWKSDYKLQEHSKTLSYFVIRVRKNIHFHSTNNVIHYFELTWSCFWKLIFLTSRINRNSTDCKTLTASCDESEKKKLKELNFIHFSEVFRSPTSGTACNSASCRLVICSIR